MKDDEALTAKLAEYNARRDQIERDTEIERRAIAALEKAGNHAQAGEMKFALDRRIAPEHVRLGLWCEKNGLKPEAMAHFTTALQLNPHDQATWRHLGYVQHHGRWMSHEQIAAEEHEVQAQHHADHHWGPLLRNGWPSCAIIGRRAEAEANLAKVYDPRAIPSIVRPFGESTPAGQKMVVRLLGQIDAPPSSRRLAVLAVYGGDPELRDAAARALKGREPRDFGEWIVNLIRTPMTYQVRPVGGPGTQGALLIDSPRFRILRTYDAPPAFRLTSSYRGYVGYDPNGLPVVMTSSDLRYYQDAIEGSTPRRSIWRRGEHPPQRRGRMAEMVAAAQFKALVARERLAADVRELEDAERRGQGAQSSGPRRSCGWPWTPRGTSTRMTRTPGIPGSTSGSATGTSRRKGRGGRQRGAAGAGALALEQLLRGGDAGPHDRRSPADRVDSDRRPGAQPRRGDRRPGLPAGPGRAPQPARQDPADRDG